MSPAPPAAPPGTDILIADDDVGVCVLLREALEEAGYTVVAVHTAREAIDWLSAHAARLILLDIRLPDQDGSAVLTALQSAEKSIPFLIVSALSDAKVAMAYMRRGARDYLIKDQGFLDLVPEVVQRTLKDIERDLQLERLQREILQIADQEQRRIGQDIHDDLCQRLAAINMKLQHLAEDVSRVSPELSRQAASISHHLAEAVRVSRALARGLSPVDIGHEGLSAALTGLARDAEEIFEISCAFKTHGSCPPLEHHAATQVYRIAQEAIANAVKHAGAIDVRVVLDCQKRRIVLTVANDGQPFPEVPKSGGLGLQLMRHRAESVGAQLEFLDTPPEGATTAVRLSLPLKPAAQT